MREPSHNCRSLLVVRVPAAGHFRRPVMRHTVGGLQQQNACWKHQTRCYSLTSAARPPRHGRGLCRPDRCDSDQCRLLGHRVCKACSRQFYIIVPPSVLTPPFLSYLSLPPASKNFACPAPSFYPYAIALLPLSLRPPPSPPGCKAVGEAGCAVLVVSTQAAPHQHRPGVFGMLAPVQRKCMGSICCRRGSRRDGNEVCCHRSR